MTKWVRVYRTYNYIDKNPVIDKVRTIAQDEGLFERLGIIHELSNVGTGTMRNWFHGPTRNPQHHTIAAVITALGYEEVFTKKKTVDIERERIVAAAWLAKQPKKPKPRANGARKAKRSK
jgi:hypothetical protein